jgi:L-alanine-DL-glutamate epimerase-like enolase superfamily enzyme
LDGVGDLAVNNSHIDVSDAPGLGVTFIVDEAKKYLQEEDKHFFDD